MFHQIHCLIGQTLLDHYYWGPQVRMHSEMWSLELYAGALDIVLVLHSGQLFHSTISYAAILFNKKDIEAENFQPATAPMDHNSTNVYFTRSNSTSAMLLVIVFCITLNILLPDVFVSSPQCVRSPRSPHWASGIKLHTLSSLDHCCGCKHPAQIDADGWFWITAAIVTHDLKKNVQCRQNRQCDMLNATMGVFSL